MNYPVRVGLIDYILTRNTDKLSYALREVMSNTPPRIRNTQMNLLGSHDTVRILTALSGKTAEGRTNAELRAERLTSKENALAAERLISAYTILATLPGLPSVFYGDEAGLEGYGDPFCRMPYPWGKENEKILDRYRRLGAIRLSAKAYRDGDFELNELTNGRLIFTRSDDRFSYITIFNNSERSVKLKFSCFAYDMVRQSRCKSVDLLGYGSTVLRIKNETVFEIISEET
jgi:glycosidase